MAFTIHYALADCTFFSSDPLGCCSSCCIDGGRCTSLCTCPRIWKCCSPVRYCMRSCSHPDVLQWRCAGRAYLRWMHGAASCWPWTNRKYVRIDVCLNFVLLFVFDTVWCRNLTLMYCPNTLQRPCAGRACLRWMYGTVSRWPWTNRWCVCIGVWLDSKLLFVFDTVLDRILTLMCCSNTRPCRWRLCIYFRSMKMERCRVPPGRTARTFVLVFAWIWRCCSCSMQYEVVIVPWCVVQIHYNVDDGCTFVFVECMARYSVGAGWTARTFVLVCAWIWRCYSWSMQCEVTISPWCVSKYTTMSMTAVCLCSLNICHGVVLALDEQAVRLYWCVCLNLKVSFVFDTTWGVNLTLMCVQIHYNVDDGCTFMVVECMTRCRVACGRTASTFVLGCAWIWSYYSCSM